MMSRLNLDRIQSQLKVAVQAHQMVVAKMKTDPEHAELQQTLHNLQSEIRSLSEQQKSTVHQLRQEILTLRTAPTQTQQSTTEQSNESHQPPPAVENLSASDAVLPTISEVEEMVISELETSAVNSAITGSITSTVTAVASSVEDIAHNPQSSVSHCSTQKIEFMAGLQLTTLSNLKDLHSKRSEHRIRRGHNVHFSYGQFEPETEVREDYCSVCRRSGELLMCDVCSLVYHLQCLDPPLSSVPVGLWSCPKCQALGKLCGGKDDWPGTLALVHSYLTHKAAREDDKQKLRKLNEELIAERKLLEEKASQLADTLARRVQRRSELSDACSRAQQSYKDLCNFIAMFHT